jgi:hypothetical protein
MSPSSSMVLIGTEVFTFTSGIQWVACWLRRDIVAQGRTEREAFDNLVHAIGIHAMLNASLGVEKILGNEPPPEVVEEWKALHAKEHYR